MDSSDVDIFGDAPKRERDLDTTLTPEREARRQTFVMGTTIEHPNLKEAHTVVLKCVLYPAQDQIVIVVGPAGSGKTLLARTIFKYLLRKYAKELALDPGFLPAIYVLLSNPDHGVFDSKDYYIDILEAGNKVLFGPGTGVAPYKLYSDSALELARIKQLRSYSVAELRRAAENMHKYRGIITTLVDEAHSLAKVPAGPNRLLNQMETLKTFVSRTKGTLVLLGTYPLLLLGDWEEQLGRRTQIVHIRRYHVDESAVDQVRFEKVLDAFSAALPFDERPVLRNELSMMYQGSLGCVGVLKEWLDRAVLGALQAEQSPKARERGRSFLYHLEHTHLPPAVLLNMLKASTEGEVQADRYKSEAEARKLDAELGGAAMRARSSSSKPDNGGGDAQKPADAKPQDKRRVGQRNPARDRVGADPVEGDPAQDEVA